MPNSKPPLTRLYEWLAPVVFFSSNPLSLIGVVVVTTATVLWVFLLPTLFGHGTNNPYLGIPIFLLLPGLFIFGLILIPIGIYLRRRSRQRKGLPVTTIPQLRLDSPELRRLLIFIGIATFVNVVVAAQWGYSAVNYMDGAQFCGASCHNIMQPEYVAYQNSPHSNVACAECHIGPGVAWFVKAKLQGAGRVYAIALDNYPRPIPTPVENLRPAPEICEQCHSPARQMGDVLKVRTSYGLDRDNQPSSTVLMMKVGGKTWNGGLGIHGVHADPNSQIVFTATDRGRQTIPVVTYRAPDGKVTVYKSAGAKTSAAELAHAEARTMDCVDCHNRPGHSFQAPERAVDEALGQGQINPKLPFIKKEAVAVLHQEHANRDTAPAEIEASINAYYRTNYPAVASGNAGDIKNAIGAVQAIYLRNVFPEMKVSWGTYANNLGHTDFPGCFRCHDGDHQSADGRSIPNDCGTCHNLVAVDEKNPQILTGLGYASK
jgi:nitrate/TMAO reductase-like tetraheme cytochrome c subunit